ncbi:MAG: hypothetical protein IJK60_05725 [Clostridia bacterium]|nr:hypothetical protein [Clostridia bacterium]
MTAKKCDRCKKFYDTISERSEIGFFKRVAVKRDFDLCPDCTKDFELWVAGKAIILEKQEAENGTDNNSVM